MKKQMLTHLYQKLNPLQQIISQSRQSPMTKEPSLSFFMHDILGESRPLARIVTGIVANSDVTGLPFSKHNNNIFPITGGIPLVNHKLNGIITNNNLPFVAGLSNDQSSSTVFQNRGTNNIVTGSDNQPFVMTVLLHGGDDHDHDGVKDSISLFGVHRTPSPKSEVIVIGGSGKYENAWGICFETLLKEGQHTTDGVDTILNFNIYLNPFSSAFMTFRI